MESGSSEESTEPVTFSCIAVVCLLKLGQTNRELLYVTLTINKYLIQPHFKQPNYCNCNTSHPIIFKSVQIMLVPHSCTGDL